jgi:hypothetical protein
VIGGRVLDASTLVGFAVVRPYPQALVWTAVEVGLVLAVPAAALATAWARTPPEAQDALAVLLALPNTVIEPLDAAQAREVGRILTARPTGSGKSRATSPGAGHGDPPLGDDAVRAGQVVACGLRRGWPIVSGEPRVLRELDPRVEVDELP